MASFEEDGEKGESAPPPDAIDATTDEGMAQLEQMGLPVKVIRTE